MADKCKRGEYEMPNGSCYSDRRILKALTAEVSGNPGGYSCTPETGPLKPGISVVGKGRNLYASRHGYGRCVHLKDLKPAQRMRILERIIKDRILTSHRAGKVSPR